MTRRPNLHPETLAVHAGRGVDPQTGAVAPSISLSTTFERDADGGYERGYEYARSANPTRQTLEECIAQLEGGTSAAAFASGSAASLAVFLLADPGGHIIATEDAYHGTLKQLHEILVRWGVELTRVDTTDIDAVRAAFRDNTKLLWIESPSNPLLNIADLQKLSEIAHQAGVLAVCDSTFATPILQQPLQLGCDFVVHSATKYLGGHSDICGGVVVGRDEQTFEPIRGYQNRAGSVPSPFDCWLLLRSISTLPCRIEKQSANASRIASYLNNHSGVERVFYPGLSDHPGHALAKQQMAAPGAMLSFCVNGAREEAFTVAAKTKLFIRATSLGGVESLIEHRASIEGENTFAPENLLRLSVGIEHPDDLINDLEQALS